MSWCDFLVFGLQGKCWFPYLPINYLLLRNTGHLWPSKTVSWIIYTLFLLAPFALLSFQDLANLTVAFNSFHYNFIIFFSLSCYVLVNDQPFSRSLIASPPEISHYFQHVTVFVPVVIFSFGLCFYLLACFWNPRGPIFQKRHQDLCCPSAYNLSPSEVNWHMHYVSFAHTRPAVCVN